MAKQTLFDILIVLVIPMCLVTGYIYIGADSLSSIFSSVISGMVSLPGGNGEDVGTKTKEALNELNSINLDKSFLDDPAFLTLVDFTGTVGTTSVGRQYPFSLPDEIVQLMKKASTVEGNVVASSTTLGAAMKPKTVAASK